MKKTFLKIFLSLIISVFFFFSLGSCILNLDGYIALRNTSGLTILEVDITRNGNPSWGSDWLTSNIPNGDTRIFQVPQGYWDMQVYDSIGPYDSLAIYPFGIYVSPGSTVYVQATGFLVTAD